MYKHTGHGLILYGVVWCGVGWFSVVWCGVLQYGIACVCVKKLFDKTECIIAVSVV